MEIVSIERITSPYGEERFKELDRDYIDNFKKNYNWSWSNAGFVEKKPILITKDYKIIDGHHRYLAYKELGIKEISVIKLNCWFEETEKLRDFQKHLKGMVPEDWDNKQLKEEFEGILLWLIKQLKN